MTARSIGWRVAQVALLGVVAYGIFRTLAPELEGVSWREMASWPVRPGPLVVSTALLLTVYLAHAGLWRRIMSDLAIAQPTPAVTLRVYFLASLGRYIPGRLWQLAGLAVLAQRAGMPAGRAAAAAVLGQVGFLSTGLLFLAFTLPGRGGAGTGAWVAAAVTMGAVVAVWFLLVSPAAHGVRARFASRLGSGRAGAGLAAAVGLADAVRLRHAALWAVAYAGSWVVLAIAFTIFASAFVPGVAGEFRHLGGTVAAAYLAGYIAVFAPGGIVVRELAMTALLAEVMPTPAALIVAVASRVWFTTAELLPLAALPLLPTRPA